MAGASTWITRAAIVLAVAVIATQVVLAAMFILDATRSTTNIDIAPDGGGVDGEAVQGKIRFQHPDAEVFHIVDAQDTIVATTDAGAGFDTRQLPNGPYTVDAVADGRVLDSRSVVVQNPRSDAATTAAAVGVAAAASAGGSAIGSGVAGRVAIAAAQIGKESLMAIGEDHLAMRTKGRRHLAGWAALLLTLLLVLLFFPFEAVDGWAAGEWWRALPIAGGVACVFVALALGIEYALGIAGRATTKVRFLGSGALSLAASSLLLRMPFGYPGYVEEVQDDDGDAEDDEPPHVEGWRALATMTALLTLLMPFLWVAYSWRYDVAEEAMQIALVALATSALPIKPMPGYDIWTWHRGLAVLYAVGAFTLFFGYQLAFTPPIAYWMLGTIGAFLYAGVFIWLRARSADPQPAWYPRAVMRASAWRAWWRQATPAALRSAWQATSRASAGAADGAVRGIQRALQALLAPFIALAAHARIRRMEQEAARLDRASEMELAAILDATDGVDDETLYTRADRDEPGRVGDVRDEAMRMGLRKAFPQGAPDGATVRDRPSGRSTTFTR